MGLGGVVVQEKQAHGAIRGPPSAALHRREGKGAVRPRQRDIRQMAFDMRRPQHLSVGQIGTSEVIVASQQLEVVLRVAGPFLMIGVMY